MNTYFDNAASSFPKPKLVCRYMKHCIDNLAGNYGRNTSPDSLEIAHTFFETRDKLSKLFKVDDSAKIIFTLNATQAMNTILFGLKLKNKRILISPMEHNCVTRPLAYLKQQGVIDFDILPAESDGFISVDNIPGYIKQNTALVIINHESNVNGVVQDIYSIKQQIGNIPLLLDVAQSAGHFEIDNQKLDTDFIVFTGHKALLGPTGIGGFYVKEHEKLKPLMYGGTGSISESLDMPQFCPDKFEAGTPNIVGIFGLNAGISNLPQYENKQYIVQFIDELRYNSNYQVHASNNPNRQGLVVSITHPNKSITSIYNILQEKFRITSRIGLHCSPLAHKHIGTYPSGTIRFSFSAYHNQEDIKFLLSSLREIQ